MIVIIAHPTEELKLIRLQKKLIEMLNDDDNIWFRNVPLWIPLPADFTKNDFTTSDLKKLSPQIESITLENLKFSQTGKYFFLSVQIKTKTEALCTELPLVYKLNQKKQNEQQTLQNKIQAVFDSNLFEPMPLKQCQIAAAAKLHDLGTAVQSSKTCSYVLQDSVWFKQSK